MNCASASLFGSEPLLSMNCATKLLIHRFSARFHWSIQYDYTNRRAQIQWIICIEGSPNLQCTLGCQRFCNPNIPEFKMMKYGKIGLMLQQDIKVESIRNVGQRLRKEIRRFWKTICRLLGWITSLQWLKTHICTMVKTNSLKNPCYPEQPTDSAIWLLRICLSLRCMDSFVLFCPNWWYGYPEARKDRDSAASQVCHWQSDRKGGQFCVFFALWLKVGEKAFSMDALEPGRSHDQRHSWAYRTLQLHSNHSTAFLVEVCCQVFSLSSFVAKKWVHVLQALG